MKLNVEINYITISMTIVSVIFLGVIFFSNFEYNGQIGFCAEGYDFKFSRLSCAQTTPHIEMTGYVTKNLVEEEKPKAPHVERSPHPCSTDEDCEPYGRGIICEKEENNDFGFCGDII